MQLGLLTCFLIVVQCSKLRENHLKSKQELVTGFNDRKFDQGKQTFGVQWFNHTPTIISTKHATTNGSKIHISTSKSPRQTEVVPSVQKTRLTKNRNISNRKLSNRKNKPQRRISRVTGTNTKPTGTKTKPSGTKTKPTGTKTKSTGTKTKSTGTKTKPTGINTKSTNTITKPAGTKTNPTGTKTKLTGTKTKPTGTKTKQTGTKTKQSGTKRKPNDIRKKQDSMLKTTISPIETDDMGQQECTSLETLFDSRYPKLQNKKDETLIRKHLITLDAMTDYVSRNQTQLIQNIANSNVQRIVLKTFVNCTINRSGIMKNDSTDVDVDSLLSLHDMVYNITFGNVYPGTAENALYDSYDYDYEEIERNPFGNLELNYWAHLTGGIIDMTCALCKHQDVYDCVLRYCADDNEYAAATPTTTATAKTTSTTTPHSSE